MTAGTGPVARSTAALADDAAAAFDGSSTVLEIARQLSLRSVQVAQLWSDAEIEFPDSPEASSSVWRAAVQRLFDPAALSAAGVPAVDANMAMAGLIYLHGPLYESVRDRWFDFASHLAVKPRAVGLARGPSRPARRSSICCSHTATGSLPQEVGVEYRSGT